jgi:hypothetical protein
MSSLLLPAKDRPFGIFPTSQETGDKMTACDSCNEAIDDGRGKRFNDKLLCEDCYIAAIWPKVRKSYYEYDPDEFMRRLQNSYSVHPQQYH